MYAEIVQPNHVETVVAKMKVDGEEHLVKFSRYHDNPQFWTVPGVRDDRLHRGNKIVTVTEPSPDEYELYDLTLDPLEQHNLAHPQQCRRPIAQAAGADARAPGRADRCETAGAHLGRPAGLPAAREGLRTPSDHERNGEWCD